jgi:hypothetical protein
MIAKKTPAKKSFPAKHCRSSNEKSAKKKWYKKEIDSYCK